MEETKYAEEIGLIKSYLRDIRYEGLLSLEEEQKLAEKISTGDMNARQQMIRANLGFVINIGKEYLNSGLPYNDIIQEGNIGLIRAVDNYDYKKGIRFRTYAIDWIRHTIEKAIMNQAKTRPPKYGTPEDMQINHSTTIEEINRYEKIEKWLAELKPKVKEVISLRFGLEGLEPKTLEEIGQRFGLSSEYIRKIETIALAQLKRMTNMQDQIRAFFDELDVKINYLDELYETGHRDEARVLCSCYIDWMASAMYWPEERTNFNFVRILKEYGGDEIFLHIHPKMLEGALLKKANDPKWTAICNKISTALQQARGRLYDEQEIIDLLSSLLNNSEIDDVKKEVWRGTFAAIVYSRIRIPSVHGLGAPDEISFDNTTYQGKQVPPIDFPMLYPCLKRIAVIAREKSLSIAKFFGHDYKQSDIT